MKLLCTYIKYTHYVITFQEFSDKTTAYSNYLKYTFSTNLIRPLSNLAHDFSEFLGGLSCGLCWRPPVFLLVSCSFHLQRHGEWINTHRTTTYVVINGSAGQIRKKSVVVRNFKCSIFASMLFENFAKK